MMLEPAPERLRIPNDQHALQAALVEVLCDMARRGVEQANLEAARVVLDEGLNNAFHHGNGALASRLVTLEYLITDSFVEIMVADEGSGFDPELVPDPRHPANLSRPSGRGLFLMREVASLLAFNGTGNEVRAVMRRGEVCAPIDPWQWRDLLIVGMQPECTQLPQDEVVGLLQTLPQPHHRGCVLDLKHLAFINPLLLEALLHFYQAAAGLGRKVFAARVHPDVNQALRQSPLVGLIPLLADIGAVLSLLADNEPV